MELDMITMRQRELQRLPVIDSVLAKQITQVEAARCLGLSDRQIRRLQGRRQREGPQGLAHRARGRPSNRRLPATLQHQVVTLVRDRYPDFGPTLAGEKLAEVHKIRLSDETLRQWMRQAGLWAGRRRPRPHRQWRERAACRGQMVQLDGSHHDWLEGRGPRLVLMGYVDDATGRVYARFYPSEDLAAALDSFQRYCRLYGVPQSVYLDKHTIYRSPKEPTLEEQLQGRDPQSQFERALTELGVRVIHANSPQAKGRVERLFGTLQDRLVKELRLAAVRGLPAANGRLQGFLPAYTARVARPARQPADLHRPLPPGMRLDQILCIKEPRVVANDGTIQLNAHHLQLRAPGVRSLAKQRVTVTITPRGRTTVLYEGRALPYRVLPMRPRPTSRPTPPARPRRRGGPARPPAPDHPWRQFEYVQKCKQFHIKPYKPKKRTFLSWRKPDISTLA